MHTEPPSALLDRVRKLLAKAEAEGVTPPEAEALTAKAAELMARYGIDRARLAAARPDTDRPTSRIIDIDNPWAQVRAHLLAGLAGAMRCQCVLLYTPRPGARVHVFGFASDLERADILSWLLGFVTAVITRVRAAEDRAAAAAEAERHAGPSTALVLADRAVIIRRQVEQAYPVTRRTRITYSGGGYRAGYAKGELADIGNARLASAARALSRG